MTTGTPEVTQICTPERAEIHAAINVLTKPSCACIPLLETCEILARHEAATTADLQAKLEAAEGRIAGLEMAIGQALMCTPSIHITGVQRGNVTRAIGYDCGNPWEILSDALATRP